MSHSLLVRLFGFSATLVHGDALVLERWRWLKARLPRTRNGETLLDVGCGTGAFTIGAARRGYRAVGLSWDERNQRVAEERADICRATTATFIIGDARKLDQVSGLSSNYDVIICSECVEHILDDATLFREFAARLKPGGRLLLTTPNYYHRPMSSGDLGPFLTEETGWHVRRGYTPAMLDELCKQSGLMCEEVSYCGGYLSSRATAAERVVQAIGLPGTAAWVVAFPFRLPAMLLPDNRVTKLLGLSFTSICLEAYKPRYSSPDFALVGVQNS